MGCSAFLILMMVGTVIAAQSQSPPESRTDPSMLPWTPSPGQHRWRALDIVYTCIWTILGNGLAPPLQPHKKPDKARADCAPAQAALPLSWPFAGPLPPLRAPCPTGAQWMHRCMNEWASKCINEAFAVTNSVPLQHLLLHTVTQ
jgi:hypothetical protein